MIFVVSTQYLENYGAHEKNGKFEDGNAYWKMKGGTDYIVEGLDRIQDAVAFVMAKYCTNDLHSKEFPVDFKTFQEWESELLLDGDDQYTSYVLSETVRVNPWTA